MSQDQNVHIKSEVKPGKFSPTVWIAVLAFMVVALLAFGFVSTSKALNEAMRGSNLSLNPELSSVQRYAEAAARNRASDYLATNPELMIARRYAAEANKALDADFLATNPEIMVYRRFAAGH